jgi:hypothetical protein
MKLAKQESIGKPMELEFKEARSKNTHKQERNAGNTITKRENLSKFHPNCFDSKVVSPTNCPLFFEI